MGWFSKDIANMDDLFVHTLRDIYYAEHQIRRALPDMVDKATNADLKQGFQTHLRETEQHIVRLQGLLGWRFRKWQRTALCGRNSH